MTWENTSWWSIYPIISWEPPIWDFGKVSPFTMVLGFLLNSCSNLYLFVWIKSLWVGTVVAQISCQSVLIWSFLRPFVACFWGVPGQSSSIHCLCSVVRQFTENRKRPACLSVRLFFCAASFQKQLDLGFSLLQFISKLHVSLKVLIHSLSLCSAVVLCSIRLVNRGNWWHIFGFTLSF